MGHDTAAIFGDDSGQTVAMIPRIFGDVARRLVGARSAIAFVVIGVGI